MGKGTWDAVVVGSGEELTQVPTVVLVFAVTVIVEALAELVVPPETVVTEPLFVKGAAQPVAAQLTT